jgi:hypothetical protein
VDPWIAGIIAVVVMFPHLIWLDQGGGITLVSRPAIEANVRIWLRLLAALLVGHIGLGILVVLGRGFTARRRRSAPSIIRNPVDPLAKKFVYFFALAPALAFGLLAFVARRAELFIAPPLVVLTGLAVIVAAGDRIRIVYQRLSSLAWIGLLVLPPLMVAGAVAVLPYTLGIDLPVAQPATEMGRFFAESFQRRTGRPLAIVAGERHVAALVAVGAPSRPSLYLDATPDQSFWVSRQDIDDKGAVVVWPTQDTDGTPPPDIRARFPDLVPEVPRAFERRFQGFLPLVRIGWGVIRPRGPAQ